MPYVVSFSCGSSGASSHHWGSPTCTTFGLAADAPLRAPTPTLLCQGTGALLVELISRQPSEASSPGTLSLARGKPMKRLPSSLWTRVTGAASSFLEFSGERVISVFVPSNPGDTHHALQMPLLTPLSFSWPRRGEARSSSLAHGHSSPNESPTMAL